MPPIEQSHVKNRILAALPKPEFDGLAEKLTLIPLVLGDPLHRAGDQIEFVYFVETGFISALAVLTDGQPVETGLVGPEGLAGASIILGATTSHSETMCQSGGAAYRMPSRSLMEAAGEASVLQSHLLRYAHAFNVQVSQTAACNTHHDVGQRLARWLLAAHDRSEKPELSLTQDLIAVVLGVRRSTVSIAARMLQRAGFIRYQHGRILITDRENLESASCECYETVAQEYRSLFGEPARI